LKALENGRLNEPSIKEKSKLLRDLENILKIYVSYTNMYFYLSIFFVNTYSFKSSRCKLEGNNAHAQFRMSVQY
jgi:hypothetical protein